MARTESSNEDYMMQPDEFSREPVLNVSELLARVENDGELLRELIDNLRAQPAQNSAQVIERWSGKPGGDSLEKLLQREQIVADAVAAAGELRAALGKLADLVVARRLEALEEKSRSTRLEPEELLEFQRLMLHRVPRDARGG